DSHLAHVVPASVRPGRLLGPSLTHEPTYVIGLSRVASGQRSLGDVIAFIQYSRQFTFPIVQTASIANVLQSAVASAERVFELLDEAEEIPDPVAPHLLASPAGEVAFEGVSFRYEPAKPRIEDLHLHADPGET